MNEFVAGFASGLCQSVVGHPFDTMKVQLQKNKNTSFKNTNIKQLYKGIAYPTLTMGIIQSVGFGITENINKKVDNYFVSGAIAGVASGIRRNEPSADRFGIHGTEPLTRLSTHHD